LADIGSPVRNVNVGLADVLTGKWMDFNLSTNFMDVMKGSFAYAGFFEPYKAMDTEWFDGSSIWDVDAFSAINKCLETHTPANIKVDVILTSEKELKVVDPSNFKTIEMGWRFLHVSRYYKQMDGLLRAQFAYPEVEWCVISPTTALDDGRLPLVSKVTKLTPLSRISMKPRLTPCSLKERLTALPPSPAALRPLRTTSRCTLLRRRETRVSRALTSPLSSLKRPPVSSKNTVSTAKSTRNQLSRSSSSDPESAAVSNVVSNNL